ncbi:MAG: peroxidase-related enzyme [Gammaproteobacteria bacterium]|nr:peroxidase-related enzyme [Gammaproteobacteria bacterium]
MAKFPSLPPIAQLTDVFRCFPKGLWPLCEYHDAVLRAPSPLAIAERELIAAYVSGVNACNYCHGAHKIYAEIHGIDPAMFDRLMADPQSAAIDPKLLPILNYVRKLTLSPSSVRDSDAAAVYAAGWSEEALYDAVCVCALFNFMNRIVEGCGVVTDAAIQAQQRERVAGSRDNPETYRNFARMLGVTG